MVKRNIRTCSKEKLDEILRIVREWNPETPGEIAALADCSVDLVGQVLRMYPIEVSKTVRRKSIEQIRQEIEKEREKKEVVGMILPYIYEVARRHLSDADKLAYDDALRVLSSYEFRDIKPDFEELFSVFSRYHQALKNGQRVSLGYLCGNSQISEQALSRYLRRAGRKAIGLGYERGTLTVVDKSRLERAFGIDMPALDLGYFILGEGRGNLVYSFFRKMERRGLKRPKIRNFIVSSGRINQKTLNYEACSKIYEARDAGFSWDESAEYAQTSLQYYDYAINNEPEISSKILNTLRIIFPNKNPEKPYMTW